MNTVRAIEHIKKRGYTGRVGAGTPNPEGLAIAPTTPSVPRGRGRRGRRYGQPLGVRGASAYPTSVPPLFNMLYRFNCIHLR